MANKIQGLTYYDTPANTHLVAGQGTKFYSWDGTVWRVMGGYTMADSEVAFSAAQGVDKLLVTDGSTLRRWTGTAWEAAFTTGATDPPRTCTILLWHAGRMWAAGFPGTSAGKENDALYCSASLAYGNGSWDSTAQNFRVGVGTGDPITGLASIQDFTMAVLKRNSIWLLATDPSVALPSAANAIGECLSYGTGCVGKRAFCVYGNDLLFVSPDKTIRSLQRMQSASGQYQLSAPLSLPISPFMDRVNWDHANLINVIRYRELALFAVPLDEATTPNAVLAWNGRLQRWVGFWTGWTPTDWCVTRFGGTQRLVHGDQNGNVRQWKDFADAQSDSTYLDDGAAITSRVKTRSMLFGEPLNDKDGYHCEARFGTANAILDFTAVADGVELTSWSGDLRQTGPGLPVNLPFDLVNLTNRPIRKGLRGLKPWNEIYLEMVSTAGWFSLRNVSFSAFVNTLANQ